MKVYLCVAPDGRLEEWFWWRGFSKWECMTSDTDALWFRTKRTYGPEFWGREIIDEWSET